MSQKVTRKSAVSDEKEKRTDSPVKDMKKKVAANAEKEKQAVEKPTDKQADKVEKPKQVEKPAEKNEKQKQPEKPAEKNDKQKQPDKPADKNEKQKQPEKPVEKNEKTKQPEKATEKDKPADKSIEKTEKKVEKNGVDNKKTEKKDVQDKKDDKPEKNVKADAKKNGEKSKQNGSKHNGDANGVEEASDDDVLEIPDDDEFPELAYDDTSDNEAPSPDALLGRSATRRSQVKATRTPETPQPAAEKPQDITAANTGAGADAEPKDKVLKLTDAPPTDRKLRSDDPKPERKEEEKKKENGEKEKDGDVIEIDADEEPRKTDTNYSKSRVKVSPYRRSTRLHDQTTSSVIANYTGNNTTMEMDITESSFGEEPSLDDSSYLSGLRAIRGRRSYKPLKELALKHNRSARSNASISASELSSRPTGTVVGRKRKPEDINDSVEVAAEAGAGEPGELSSLAHTKRMRLLDRIAQPFRRTLASTPLPNRRNPEIVGINTDLPLSAPVSPPPLDPESLKGAPLVTVSPPTPAHDDMDKKKCVIM